MDMYCLFQEWSDIGPLSHVLGVYLQQQASFFSARQLADEMAAVWGSVIHTAQESIQEDRLQDLSSHAFAEEKE